MPQLHSSQGALLDRGFTDYILTTVESSFPLQVVKSAIPGAGLGVVALEPIPASWTVFKVKEPLVTQIENHKRGELCDRCFSPCKRSAKPVLAVGSECASSVASTDTLGNVQSDTTNGVSDNDANDTSFNSALPLGDRCGKCDRVHFCSMGCQEAAAKSVQKMCFQTQLDTKDMHSATLMAIRLSMRHSHPLSANERLSINTLACHPEEQGGDGDDQLQNLLALKWNNLERVKLMYFKVKTNALPVTLSGAHEVCGSTLDAFSALINHSCDPNCYFVMENGKLCFRTLRDIPAGSELLIDYLDAPGADVGFRRPKLLEKYRFLCQCPRCLGEYRIPSRLRPLLATPSGQRIYNQTLFGFIDQAKTVTPTQQFLDRFNTVVNTVVNTISNGLGTGAVFSSSIRFPHPLPTAWQLIAQLHLDLGHHTAAFKTMLHVCFDILPHTHHGTLGPHWVASLHLLLSSAAFLAADQTSASENAYTLPDDAQASGGARWQRKLVVDVYRAFLVDESDRWCGPDAEFVRRYKRELLASETGRRVTEEVVLVKDGVAGYFDMFVWGQRLLFAEMGIVANGIVVREGRLVLG